MTANNKNRWPKRPNPDHVRPIHTPAPADPDLEQRLHELVLPAVLDQLQHYQQLGLRSRALDLPTMAALIFTLLWRNVPGQRELLRLAARERLLWREPLAVSQPALCQRFHTLPPVLLEHTLATVLAQLPARIAARQRPLPAELAALPQRFTNCYALDGSTLAALFRKVGLLREQQQAPLAGHMLAACGLLDRLPAKIWLNPNPTSDDRSFINDILAWAPSGSLLCFDLGFFAFHFFDSISAAGSFFVSRLREKTSYTVEQVIEQGPTVRQSIVRLGKHHQYASEHSVRLVEVQLNGEWWRYITNVREPERLSVGEVVSVYAQRWSIERVFKEVKRLLNLHYLWVGGANGVALQVWSTWLFYAVLVDLCDEVAELLGLASSSVSLEMVYRGLYHYSVAVAGGYSGSAAEYLAAAENKDLGVVKRRRRRDQPTLAQQVRLALTANS